MISHIRNLISNPNKIKSSINKLKNVNNNFEIISKPAHKFEYRNNNIIRDPQINKLYNKVILNQVHDFVNGKDFYLTDSYLKWSRSDDNDYQVYPNDYWDKNFITCVLSDNEIEYSFFDYNNVIFNINEKDLLIFDSNLAIKFFNHNKSNLLIFSIYTCKEVLCKEMLNKYREEKDILEEEDEEQLVSVGRAL